MERPTARHRVDWVGALIGLLTFAGGIALLVVTFQLAYSLFTVPPRVALGQGSEKAVNLVLAGESFAAVIVRVMLLFVMSIVGSIVANRGIRLYVSSRIQTPPEKPEAPAVEPVRERRAV